MNPTFIFAKIPDDDEGLQSVTNVGLEDIRRELHGEKDAFEVEVAQALSGLR